jgi:8-oxo-dGTP diphosphatase
MPHIHSEPGQHDLTASAFIVRNDEGEAKILLHRHKKLGKLLQPGGHTELHETPWQSVLHEIIEETGYELTQLKVLQPKQRMKFLGGGGVLHPQDVNINTHPFDEAKQHFHTDIAYAFVADSVPTGEPDEGESTDLRWLTVEELKRLSNDDIFDGTRDIAVYVLTEVSHTWEPVELERYTV